jgi:uncharacterized peroxidase-related enzyme
MLQTGANFIPTQPPACSYGEVIIRLTRLEEGSMAHVTPLPRQSLTELEQALAGTEARMGFLPNSLLTMGRRPALLRAFSALGQAVNAPNPNVPPVLKSMIAHIASSVAGCRYCMAHTASNVDRAASDEEKLKVERLGAFETDPIFSEKERATLAFAAAAAAVPNTVEASHFARLRQFYSDEDIVDIVSVVAMFGFLNRWNDTMATDLEPEPIHVGETKLKARGWTPGKHAPAASRA